MAGHECFDGWICEAHPERGFPHDDCPGPGMPCQVRDCTLFVENWNSLVPLPGIPDCYIFESQRLDHLGGLEKYVS